MDRLDRHARLAGFGPEGVQAVRDGRVLIIGLGGLGSPAARYLAASGVGTLSLCDFAEVDAPDLQRQILYGDQDIGQDKLGLAAGRLAAAHRDVIVRALPGPFHESMIEDHDVVLDCTDDAGTRAWIHAACLQAGTPLVWGALEAWEGQASTVLPGGPCLRCLWPEPAEAPACADVGVFAPLAGQIGLIMAAESLRILLGAPALSGTLLLVDGRAQDSQKIPIAARPGCQCGASK